MVQNYPQGITNGPLAPYRCGFLHPRMKEFIHQPISALSHLLSAVVLIYVAYRMLLKAGPHKAQRFGITVFFCSAFFLLTMSGIYHACTPGLARDIFRRLDYTGIFIMIAGTFTVVQIMLFRGWWRWGLTAFVWVTAVVGAIYVTYYFDEMTLMPKLAILLGQGWVSGLAVLKAFTMYPISQLKYGVIGGLVYTAGTWFLATDQPVIAAGWFEGHEVWHLFVIAGMAFHIKFVWDRLNVKPV